MNLSQKAALVQKQIGFLVDYSTPCTYNVIFIFMQLQRKKEKDIFYNLSPLLKEAIERWLQFQYHPTHQPKRW